MLSADLFQSWLQDFWLRFGATADALICITSLRKSAMICWSSDVLDSRDSSLSDSFIIEHQLLLCHYFDFVLFAEDLLIFVEVVQILVQWLIE